MKALQSLRAAGVSVCIGTGLCLLALASGAAGDEQPVVIRFDARVGDQPLNCGESFTSIGTTQAAILVQDFRIYVSTMRMVTRKGR